MGRLRSSTAAALAFLLLAVPSSTPASGSSAPGALEAVAAARGLPAPSHDPYPAVDALTGLAALYRTSIGLDPGDAIRERIGSALADLPVDARDAIGRIALATAAATRARDLAFAGLSAAELQLAARVGWGAADPGDRARAAGVIARIDGALMLDAAARLRATVDAARPSLRGIGVHEPTCLPFEVVCIGTTGDDVWTHDVQILIDGGGDDIYLNNAGGVLSSQVFWSSGGCLLGGGTTGKARPNLECSPAPATVCTYDVLNRATGSDGYPVVHAPGHVDPDEGGAGNNGSCGNADRQRNLTASISNLPSDPDSRGVAVLLDLDGSDTYTVPWSHDDPLFGLIEDCYPGELDRVNTNRDLFQGSALAGISLLWDDGTGDDRYRGRLNAQASGHVGGVGMLISTGEGDTHFWADRLSQGNGIAGGAGILVNSKDGEHTYLLDAPVVYRNEFAPNGRGCAQEGRAGQGEGGFGGMGILWTDAGDATYRAVAHVTENAHPFSPVLGPNGSPLLVGGSDAQGSGESFPIADSPGGVVAGIGLLLDRTDGDTRVCPAVGGTAASGMHTGSTTGPSGSTDLSSAGEVDRVCGTFNLPPELAASDLATALQHLSAGAVGVRVVVPA